MAYVYSHIRLDKNEIFYIGIGSDNKYKRAYEKTRRNNIWNKIVAKTQYKVVLLNDNITYDEAKILEKKYILQYGRIDIKTGHLSNMTDGGDGTINKVFTEEYRKKLSIASRKRGLPPGYYKMQLARKNYVITAEQRKKLSDAKKGSIISEKCKQICKERMLTNNPSKGKTGKDSINYKYDVECYKDGVLINIFNGVHDASRQLNLNPSKICAVINGRRNATGGYNFKKRI